MYGKTVLLLLLACLQYGLSIRCFDCNSANNSMCLDPTVYDRETVEHFLRSTECGVGVQAALPAGDEFFCRKIVQVIFHKGYASEVRVTRGCGWKRDYIDRPCYKADNEDHLETVCQCFSDDCNGAEGVQINYVMLGFSLICCKIVNMLQGRQ